MPLSGHVPVPGPALLHMLFDVVLIITRDIGTFQPQAFWSSRWKHVAFHIRKLRLREVEKCAQAPVAKFKLKSIQLLCPRQCFITTLYNNPSDHSLS